MYLEAYFRPYNVLDIAEDFDIMVALVFSFYSE